MYCIILRIKSYDDDRLSKAHLPITLLDISTTPSKMGQMSGQPLSNILGEYCVIDTVFRQPKWWNTSS
jgi:hypothetical protein